MKYLLLIVLLISCSSYKRVQKNWDSIQEEIKKHPELVDSLKLVRHDTIRSVEFKDRIVEVKRVDSVMVQAVDSLCEQLKATRDKPHVIFKLQTKICPELTRDTTYHLKLYNKRVTLYVPIHLSVFAKGGLIDIRIMSDSVQMPDPSVITNVEFRPLPRHFYADPWFWAALFLLILLTLVLVQLARRL